MAQTAYDKQRPRRTPPVAPLAAIRASHSLTQEVVCQQVASITNKTFTKGALSAIEQGHRGASAETLAALETALRLPSGSLVVDYDPGHDRRPLDAA